MYCNKLKTTNINFSAHKKFLNDIYNNKLETKNINFLANKKFLEQFPT